MIEVKTDSLREKIRRTMATLEEVRNREVKLSDEFLGKIKERTPVDSGDTQKSWMKKIKRDANGVEWELNPEGKEKIVTFLEWGTREHVILPKDKEALSFTVDGESVVTKKVYHPGTKPLGIVRITRAELEEAGRKLVSWMHERLASIWT